MSDAQAADDKPFQTAPEIAREIAAELDFGDETTARTVDLAERYGGLDAEPVLPYTPRSIAAGAAYVAALENIEFHHLTQADVADAVGQSRSTVGSASRAIRREEYDSAEDGSDTEGEGLLARVWQSLTGGEN